ncbi:hypothetical protein [Nocardioides sp.]|uniref:hypothetical protein n=1 Tax=Nocardioides sp. TaxID=35761 RepID=UPI0025DB1C62|nr:hypothetical protein [Nocardioides sp.]
MDLADPDRLEALAGVLEARAEDVRERRQQFRSAVAAVPWTSAGAAAYRARCDELSADLLRNADDLDRAAADLRAHAKAVRERIAWMHDMVARLRDEAREAWDAADGAFEWTADRASDAWNTVRGWL